VHDGKVIKIKGVGEMMADKERLSLLDGVRKVEDAVDLMTLMKYSHLTVTLIPQILINWHILGIINYDMKL